MSIESRCPRCGLFHGFFPEEIAKECLAVKRVSFRGYVYGPNGLTVSHPGIESIEFVSPEDQSKLIDQSIGVKPNEH